MTIVQMYFEINSRPLTHWANEPAMGMRYINIETLGIKALIHTSYIGVLLITLGAMLEIIGFIGTKLRKKRKIQKATLNKNKKSLYIARYEKKALVVCRFYIGSFTRPECQ